MSDQNFGICTNKSSLLHSPHTNFSQKVIQRFICHAFRNLFTNSKKKTGVNLFRNIVSIQILFNAVFTQVTSML